jgi:acyl-CoA reductase-like NAD-dependent aldehyde dehydrogenase
VHVNAPTVHDEVPLPNSGVKNRAYGRFGSTNGLGEFLAIKTIEFRVRDIA